MKFNELKLDHKLIKALDKMGLENATEIQEKAIPVFLSGKNLFGKSGTGTGKTAAFVVPIIQQINPGFKKPQAIILTPTRDLTNQIVDQIRKIINSLEGIAVASIIGGMRMSDQIHKLKKSQIIVGTPGRIKDHIDRGTLKLNTIKTIILDEADEMLKMGFKNEIDSVFEGVEEKTQIGLFSATNNKKVMEIANNYMHEYEMVEINNTVQVNGNISNSMIFTKGVDKQDLIIEVFKKHDPKRVIIFTNTKSNTDKIQKILRKSEINSVVINGDKKQSQRTQAIKQFKNKEVNVMVATDVVARGIDIPDIDYVINYDISMEDEHFVHRIGRTGRNGATGNTISFVHNKNTLTQLNGIKSKYLIEIDELLLTKYDVETKNDREISRKENNRRSDSNQGNNFKKRSNSNDRRNRNSRNGERKDSRTNENSKPTFSSKGEKRTFTKEAFEPRKKTNNFSNRKPKRNPK